METSVCCGSRAPTQAPFFIHSIFMFKFLLILTQQLLFRIWTSKSRWDTSDRESAICLQDWEALVRLFPLPFMQPLIFFDWGSSWKVLRALKSDIKGRIVKVASMAYFTITAHADLQQTFIKELIIINLWYTLNQTSSHSRPHLSPPLLHGNWLFYWP